MKKHPFLLTLLAVMLVLILYGMVEVSQTGNTLQYLFPAPKEEPLADPPPEKLPKTNAQLSLERLEETSADWQNIISAYTLTGISEGVAFSSKEQSMQGKLTAVSKGHQSLYYKQLLFGRFFYDEELEKGRDICLIDEQVAIRLFRVGDAIGQKVSINGRDYEVMGVFRHAKKIGDYEDFGVYLPFVTAAQNRLPLAYYMVSASPVKGGGARVAFKTSMETFSPGGTLWDLNRESVGATLIVRVFLFVAGLTLVLLSVKLLNKAVLSFIAKYQMRLRRAYAVRLLPWLLGFILLFALGYGLCAGAFAILVGYILEPVYIFPEWIPTVLVEWKDINDAFWKVWQQDAMVMSLRSPAIIRLRFFATLLNWMVALFAAIAPVMLVLHFKSKKVS
jgi:hypothetical protein